MRKLLILSLSTALALVLSFTLFAQPPQGKGGGGGKGAPHTNLKILPDDANLVPTMRSFTVALGVQCDFCHAQDRASDEKSQKVTARMMLNMTKEINSKFPDGKNHVACFTCHRGSNKPLMEPPAAQ